MGFSPLSGASPREDFCRDDGISSLNSVVNASIRLMDTYEGVEERRGIVRREVDRGEGPWERRMGERRVPDGLYEGSERRVAGSDQRTGEQPRRSGRGRREKD
jgi:hypothetical protein